MSLVVTSQSRMLMLGLITNKSSSIGNRKLKLFTNNLVPSIDTEISDIVECTLNGYQEVELQSSSWTIETIDGVTSANYSEQLFTIEEEAAIYGYFVTDADDDLLWVERFNGAPFFLPSGGGTIGVELNFILN